MWGLARSSTRSGQLVPGRCSAWARSSWTMCHRLARARWPGELDGAGWEDGTSPAFLRELVGWWRTRFDWRAQEAAINQFPQFRVTLDGIGLHFVHVRGKGPAPLPLILTHGWPSTFYELLPLVPLLTD